MGNKYLYIDDDNHENAVEKIGKHSINYKF